MGADVLYRWRVDATGPDPLARKRKVVNLAVAPAVAEPAVRGASCYYVSKQPRDPPPTPHTVWLTVVAPPTAEVALRAAVEPKLAGVTVVAYCVAPGDPVLKAQHAPWRRGVRAVTDVALDLHSGEFDAHRAFLSSIEPTLRGATAPPPDLRTHLLKHSAAFRGLSAAPGGEDEFWRDFFTRPTNDDVSKPGHWLYNIMDVADTL